MRVGQLRNVLNENLPVSIGKDGQEIEERCAEELVELIDATFNAESGFGGVEEGRGEDEWGSAEWEL